MAEQKGFEPLHRFPGLRDFESRLFDQLEYCSTNWLIISVTYQKSKLSNQNHTSAAITQKPISVTIVITEHTPDATTPSRSLRLNPGAK